MQISLKPFRLETTSSPIELFCVTVPKKGVYVVQIIIKGFSLTRKCKFYKSQEA